MLDLLIIKVYLYVSFENFLYDLQVIILGWNVLKLFPSAIVIR